MAGDRYFSCWLRFGTACRKLSVYMVSAICICSENGQLCDIRVFPRFETRSPVTVQHGFDYGFLEKGDAGLFHVHLALCL